LISSHRFDSRKELKGKAIAVVKMAAAGQVGAFRSFYQKSSRGRSRPPCHRFDPVAFSEGTKGRGEIWREGSSKTYLAEGLDTARISLMLEYEEIVPRFTVNWNNNESVDL
jgi:hypothetical protein